jgi:hypothetical protein
VFEAKGPAPDEKGLSLLDEEIGAGCDDAKQNSFHTTNMLCTTAASFIKARP